MWVASTLWISVAMRSPEVSVLSLGGAFAAQFRRHLKVLLASLSDALNPLLFFLMVVTLFPIGLGPDPERLALLAPGIIWVVALLASLMVSARLFGSDYEDGSLEQMALAPQPLAWLACAEVMANWMVSGVLLSLLSPLFAFMLGLAPQAIPTLMLSLLIGSLSLVLVGAIGSALTVSIRRGGLLLSLLIIPLNVPVLVLGTNAVNEVIQGGNSTSWLALQCALALFGLALAPLAVAAALRISLDS